MKKEIAQRNYTIEMETRLLNEDEKIISGLIPYNSKSFNLGGFVETIDCRAFNKTLADGYDTKLLNNHSSTKVLARVKNGSLKLENRTEGLYFEAKLNNSPVALDVYEDVKTQNISNVSFGFQTISDSFDYQQTPALRTLKEIKLLEISLVSNPAYPATSVSARSYIWEKRGIEIDAVETVLEKIESQSNYILNEDDKKIISSSVEKLNSLLPIEPLIEVVAEPVEKTIPTINPNYYSDLLKQID